VLVVFLRNDVDGGAAMKITERTIHQVELALFVVAIVVLAIGYVVSRS
jgi:hypothetical protein